MSAFVVDCDLDGIPPAEQALDTLLEALNEVADPRQARGIRYPLGATLALCVLAFVCGRQNLSGIMRFGRQNKGLLRHLGFERPRPPSVPTLSRLVAAVELSDLQRALARWLAGVIERSRHWGAIASVDGKTSRAAGVHVLNVFLHDVQQVVWQAPVAAKHNEISAFKQTLAELLEHYPFLQLVVGDAMFAGEPLCELLIENGRHYLFQIKADQKHLLEKMELIFAPHLHRPLSQAALDGEKKRRLRRRPRGLGA